MTIHDLRRPRTRHVVTPLEVWREEFTAMERLLVLVCVPLVVAGILDFLRVVFGVWG